MKKVIAMNERGYRIGESHHNAKLSNAQIDEIFFLRDEKKLSFGEIAKRMNVSKATIFNAYHLIYRSQLATKFKTVTYENN